MGLNARYLTSFRMAVAALAIVLGFDTGLGQSPKRPNHNFTSAAGVSFTEVANEAGVAGPQLGLDHGSVFADFNGDGLLDLCFTQKETPNYLFINQGDGTFVDHADAAGLNDRIVERIRGTTVADYDNDGDLDLFFCAGFNDILYRNDGNLAFTDVTHAAGVGNSGNGLVGTWGDYNRDGYVDLFVANWDQTVQALYRNNGEGSFSEVNNEAGIGYDAYVNIGLWFDYDNDGDLDIFVSRWNDEPHRLWRNEGDGSFTNVASQAGLENTVKGQGAAVADYNNDGHIDIYLASDLSPNLLFRNNGNGTFSEVGAEAGVDDPRRTVDCAWADFDNDGWMDLYIGNYDAPNALYFNNGDGTFTENSGVTADFARTIGTTIGDYDADGFLDMYTGNSDESNRLYHNEGTSNHWLYLELQGTASNRAAIGARVEVIAGSLRQTKAVSGGSGYCNQHALAQAFGLGTNTAAQQVQITWPSGAVEILENVAANQSLKIVEGQTAEPDGTPPVISGISSNDITFSSASISWNTNEASDSQVEYGLTTGYGAQSPVAPNLVSAHVVALTGLQGNTTYHYRVKSRDAAGNLAVSEDFTFQTEGVNNGEIIVLDDPLHNGTLGVRTGGQFVGEGGWQTTGDEDMIVFDLGMYIENGSLELEVRNFAPTMPGAQLRHHFLGMFRYPYGSHNVLDNLEALWDLHAGLNYNGGVKMWSYTNGVNENTQVETPWDRGQTYHLKITWNETQLQYFRNGELQLTHTHNNMQLRYLFIGRELSVCGDYVTNFKNNQYHALVGPIYANILIKEFVSTTDHAPPQIINIGVSEVYANGARLNWTTDEPAACYLEYGATNAYGQRTPVLNPPDQAFTATLDNLASQQVYHYRIVAKDDAGNQNVSPDHTFTTSAGGTYLFKPIADTYVEQAGLHGTHRDFGNFGWMNILISAGRECYFRFQTTGLNGEVEQAALRLYGRQSGNSGGTLRVLTNDWEENEVTWLSKPNVTGAELGTLSSMHAGDWNEFIFNGVITGNGIYDFALQGTGTDKVSLDCRESTNFQPELLVHVSTTDETPPVISQVSSGNVSSTSAAISWNTDEASDSQAEYGLTASYGNSSPLEVSRVTNHSINISGLSPNTLYHYRVKSRDAAGNLAVSGDFTFVTSASGGPVFSDDFSGNSLDANKWTRGANSGNQTVVTGGALHLRSTNNVSGWVHTREKFSAGNKIIQVKIVQPNGDGTIGMSPTVNSASPTGFFEEPNWYRFYNYRSGNSGPYKLFVQWKKNGAEGGLDVAPGANFTGNFHLRLRTTDAEVFFEYSFDNSNWTTAYSETFSLPGYTLDDLFAFELSAYNTPSKGEWVLDDFSINSALSNDDTTAPMISHVASGNITTTAATISWSTDEPADARVEYGTTTSYGSFSPVDPVLAMAHAIALSGLPQNTIYHFRVLSRDAAGNLGASEDNTFTTASLSSGNVAFANVQGVFNRNCVRCHQGNEAPEQLVLAEGEAYGNIVNVASTQHPQWLRVHPGNRSVSWLYEKITNPNPPVGSKMENLDADEIELIGKWIDQGATAEPAPPYAELEFRTTSLPAAEIEINYHVELVAWGGLPDYTFSVIAGSLPPGLGLDPNSGEIFGTPTATGQYSFTLRVSDRQTPAAVAEQAYALNVRSAQAHWQVPQNFEVQTIVSDLDLPVNLAFVPNSGLNQDDPYFYITQLYGQVIMVRRDFQKQVYADDLLNFDPRTTPKFEELGVEGVSVDPQTGDVFATIIYDEAGAIFGKVVRFHSTDGGRTAASQTIILEGIPAASSHSLHTLTIGLDGKLYLNVGDGQHADAAQDVNDKRGKILRMNLDGSLPDDNPFPNSYTYAYGLRNPFGAAWRNENDKLYISDNGQGTNDRLAQVSRGEDYGWPNDLTRGAIYLWNPTVAPVAMDFLRDTPFAPEYAGHLFVGLSGPTYLLGDTDRGKQIQSFELDAEGNVVSESIFLDYIGAGYATVIGVAFGPDGLYFTDLYGENGFDEAGFTHANVYRIRWVSQDTTAPVISGVQASNVDDSSVLITWQTNEPAKRQVEYGTTTDYGRQTALENDLRASHSVVLNDLTPNTTHHFRVRSWDAADNAGVSGDFSFTTTTADSTTTLLSDDFNGSTLDANKWNKGTNSDNLSGVANNQLELRSSATQTGWIITKNNYAARNTTVSVKITQPNDDGDLGMTPTYALSSTNGIYNQATWYRFYVYRDVASGPYQLFVQWKKNGVVDGVEVTGNTVLNGSFHMRMRCDDTRIYFEFSVDGQAWNTAYSEPFGLTAHTLNSAFYYELAGYRTDVKGILKADDFAINATTSGPDTQPPVISQVASGIVGTTTATITWNTDEASDSQVEYGLTTAYGNSTPLDELRLTNHSVDLANLMPSTSYHYRVKSRDAAGNLAISDDFTFTTNDTSGSTLFVDDFNTDTLDLNKWTKGSNSGNQAGVVNNALELRSTGTQTAWVVTKQKYVARNTTVAAKITQPNNDGDLGMSPTFQASSTNGIFNQANWYRFYVYREVNSGPYRLYVQWSKNGAVDGVDVTGNMNITGTVYLRLRCDDSRLHFEASLNGQNWTDTYSEVFALPGYTLDTAFNYELAGYRTDVKGRITVDDFAIATNSALAKGGDAEAPVEAALPTAFELSQNYPNPFYFNTHVRLALPEEAQVHAVIYDINGREVQQLYHGSMLTGYRVMNWDGTNAAGAHVSSGVYFMRVIFETTAGHREVMRRQLRLRR